MGLFHRDYNKLVLDNNKINSHFNKMTAVTLNATKHLFNSQCDVHF